MCLEWMRTRPYPRSRRRTESEDLSSPTPLTLAEFEHLKALGQIVLCERRGWALPPLLVAVTRMFCREN